MMQHNIYHNIFSWHTFLLNETYFALIIDLFVSYTVKSKETPVSKLTFKIIFKLRKLFYTSIKRKMATILHIIKIPVINTL